MPSDNDKTELAINRDISNWQSAEIDLRVWEATRSDYDWLLRASRYFILFRSHSRQSREAVVSSRDVFAEFLETIFSYAINPLRFYDFELDIMF